MITTFQNYSIIHLSLSRAEYLERQYLLLLVVPSNRLTIEHTILHRFVASILKSVYNVRIFTSIILLVSAVNTDLTVVRDMYLPDFDTC